VERVADSLVLRWFCRLYFQRTPHATTLLRWAATIRPETLQALNDRLVVLAKQARVTQGRKLRLDSILCADGHSSPHRQCARAHTPHPAGRSYSLLRAY
jgi:hypothetical protein